MNNKLIKLLSTYSEYPMDQMERETSLLLDLQINSLDYMRLLQDIEDEFDLEIDDDDIAEIETIGDLHTYLNL